jgi:hypothetical protein
MKMKVTNFGWLFIALATVARAWPETGPNSRKPILQTRIREAWNNE